MWKTLGESRIGTSHRSNGLPCQDAHAVAVVEHPAGPVLVAVVADGAGSAARADLGAQTACATTLEVARRKLLTRSEDFDLADLRTCFVAARDELRRVAEANQVAPRDLACTLLLAVVGPAFAGFGQLGDGAIVLGQSHDFAPVFWPDFWPEASEYVNETDFLTSPELHDRLLLACLAEPVDEVILFSDGLQRLALDYTTRLGHPGFFNALLDPLRSCTDPEPLRAPLRGVLDSDKINARTDDDKTLVLATRVRTNVLAESGR